MIMPEYVLMNHDIHGQCISDVLPRFLITAKDIHGHKCNFKILKQSRDIKQDTNTLYCTNFVIENVTATCQIHMRIWRVHSNKMGCCNRYEQLCI